jgi:hypothetical protein
MGQIDVGVTATRRRDVSNFSLTEFYFDLGSTTSAVYLKFLHRKRRGWIKELQIEERHLNYMFASAHNFP